MIARLKAQIAIILLIMFCIWPLTSWSHSNASAHTILTHNDSAALPPPYLEYKVYGDAVITDLTMPPVLPNGQADYAQLFEEHDLCTLVANDEIDEVWIWAGNGDGVTKGDMWEWTTSGLDWNGDTPDCGKVVTTMTFNYLREVDVALESYNHRMEGFFSHYFTCDFSTATWPWAGSTTWPFSQCGNLLSDRFGFVARPFAGNNQIAGCGDAHHPPNILIDEDYIYNDTTFIETTCPDWSQDGSSVVTSLNCQAWGCTHWGFHLWWMQNVPGYNNTNRDRNGNLHQNWWAYLFGAPTGQFRVFLPAALDLQTPRFTDEVNRSRFPYHEGGRQYATRIEPQRSSRQQQEIGALQSPTRVGAAQAVTIKTVYVLYYPGYGGTPRADIDLLTSELIGLLKEASVYHGYSYATLRGSFLGQDGQSFAGIQCTTGNAPDNIHIRVDGTRTDSEIVSVTVEEPAGGGRWANPCDLASNWLLHIASDNPGQLDLYFKPFRDAPDGTQYIVSIQYADGERESVNVLGTAVQTLVASFVGQDGHSYAGQGCASGNTPDNIHIHLYGVRYSSEPVSYRVDEFAGGGVWATPCDPASNWLLYVEPSSSDEVDLFFKPFRNAPDGTLYTISLQHSDGTNQTTTVVGTHVTP